MRAGIPEPDRNTTPATLKEAIQMGWLILQDSNLLPPGVICFATKAAAPFVNEIFAEIRRGPIYIHDYGPHWMERELSIKLHSSWLAYSTPFGELILGVHTEKWIKKIR